MGNLYVKFNVKFPESISPKLIAGLESALPPRTPAETYPDNIHVDEVELTEPSERDHRSHGEDATMESDDDESGGAGPQVQCAQQ